jgi:hypothetical protein
MRSAIILTQRIGMFVAQLPVALSPELNVNLLFLTYGGQNSEAV